MDGGQASSGIRLQRVGEVLQKVGHKWDNFGSADTDRIPIRDAQMKIVSERRELAKWVYNGSRFRGQKGNSG
jgi:hypothetical protein